MILSPTPENISKAALLLRNSELVAFPTETVYGLGANATDEIAIEKIYAVKGRPSNNPLIVHCSTTSSLFDLIDPLASLEIFDAVKKLSSLWPGPFSVVVPKNKSIPDITTANSHSVALRIPMHPVALALLNECKFPLAAPSANISNAVSPTRADHVKSEIGDRISLILEGGSAKVGLESTVISLLNPEFPIILRPGNITAEQFSKVLELPLKNISYNTSTSHSSLLSPGMLSKHYAPKTTLKYLKDVDVWTLPPIKIGLIAFSEGKHLDFDFHAIRVLSANGNLDEVSTGLFAALRDLDESALDLILVDTCIETGVGIAIMDRLKRAVS